MFEKYIKRIDIYDISLTKLSVAAFVLFLITVWPGFREWALSVNPLYFFIAFVLFAIRSASKFFKA